MDLFVPLTAKEDEALDRVVAALKDNDKNLTRELWVIGRLRDVAAKNARVFYALDIHGSVDLGGGKRLLVADLKDFPAKESHGNGSTAGVPVKLSSSLIKGLEDAAAIIEALNRLGGADTAWFTFDEWLRRYVSESIVEARVEVAQNEFLAP